MMYAALRNRDLLDEWKPVKHVRQSQWQHRKEFLCYKSVTNPRVGRFDDIEQVIDASRFLKELPENWDDSGASPIGEATWNSAIDVLRGAARSARRVYGLSLPVPDIGPCADGSVDLYWNGPNFRLLINVQPHGQKPSDFFGEIPSQGEGPATKVGGPFDPTRPNFDFLRLLVKR